MRFLLLVLTGFIFASCDQQINSQEADWPEVTNESKPWTRWWWHGSAVTKAGITTELESLKEAGIGGVEITPIFGVKGEEENFIEFLSPEWTGMFMHTLKEAERLGMGVDMATGTGWPFGGPWIDDTHAPKNIVYKIYQLKGGKSLSEMIRYKQEPLVRAVGKQLSIDQVRRPVSANENLQELAIDQIKFPRELPLIALMAYGENGESLDLIGKVSSGKLFWTAPEGEWELYAVFQGWHGKMVERAAPGGEGNVIDHFSRDALKTYLAKFDTAFRDNDIGSLRAFFNDSYEVDDAHGQANWTPAFLETFQRQHGYDLREHLPALFGESDEDTNIRVLTDYRTTIGHLILENFTKPWKAWGAANGAIIRNQAHGSPANILDLYAEVDIPETEGTEMLKIKFASSAANVTGKRLSSSESATWLKDHFESSLADVRENLERYLLGGINHVFYHGTAYSPDDAQWPGWLFYAAIHANDRNPWWDDFKQLNAYITRIQSFMQNSQPDNDLLVYFPVYDRYAERGSELLEHFDIRGNFYKSAVKKVCDSLLARGVSFDLISDRQIQALMTSEGKLATGESSYQALLVPGAEYMPVATMEALFELSGGGASVLFHQHLPRDVPGLGDLRNRQNRFRQVKDKLESAAIISSSLDALIQAGNVTTETLIKEGLHFNRKRMGDNYLYFIVNRTEEPVDSYVPLAKGAANAFVFNPMTGDKGIARANEQSVYVQLAPGESTLILVSESPFEGGDYPYYEAIDQFELKGPWQVSFVKGGPEFPEDMTLETLSSWTTFAGESGENFSGTATYATTFVKPDSDASAYRLELGTVHESAQVYLNDEFIGTLIGPDFGMLLPAHKLRETNELKIAVSNLMANRIRYMDLNGLAYRKFYNINFPAHTKENRRDGLFYAGHWEPLPSGLLGPVTLTALQVKTF